MDKYFLITEHKFKSTRAIIVDIQEFESENTCREEIIKNNNINKEDFFKKIRTIRVIKGKEVKIDEK